MLLKEQWPWDKSEQNKCKGSQVSAHIWCWKKPLQAQQGWGKVWVAGGEGAVCYVSDKQGRVFTRSSRTAISAV